MVQRKVTAKHASQPEPGEPKRQSSFQRQQQQKQDTRSRAGCALKKKLKMERSIMAADLETLREFDVKPNYMKPTTCSTARAERLQVKNNSETRTTPKSSLKIRSLMKKNSKGVVFNSATCSSTLKHSKFPKALDLSPGGTEAEGTSVLKVCPYSYCSLNGHRHEPLPPLKLFVSAKRKSLKNQKSLKIGSRDKKGIGLKITRPTEEVYDDFFVEIYTETPELERGSEEDIDWIGKLSDEGMDVMMNFLEYVECEQRVELPAESCQVDASGEVGEDKAETFELGSEDGGESPSPDSKTECSECFDDDFCFPEKTIFPDECETAGDKEEIARQEAAAEDDASSNVELCGLDVSNLDSELYEPESSSEGDKYLGFKDFHEATSVEQGEDTMLRREDSAENDIMEPDGPQMQKFLVSEKSKEDGNEGAEGANLLSTTEITVPEIQSEQCNGEAEDMHNPSDVENCAFDNKSGFTKVNMEGSPKKQEKNSIDPEVMKARLRIIRKKMIEDLEVTKEFNPRGPQFLEVEADPEAEKVDLRHQMMDERKNSEEWMIDYALRQAVMKMGPARKRKVALLVEAFETVAPLPVWENPSRHAASGLTLARIIQACN